MGRQAKPPKWPLRGRRAKAYVYIIQGRATGLIKIGWTSGDPNKRVANLQCGSPDILDFLVCFPAPRTKEGELHERFWQHRRHGEWFTPSPEILSFVESKRRRK